MQHVEVRVAVASQQRAVLRQLEPALRDRRHVVEVQPPERGRAGEGEAKRRQPGGVDVEVGVVAPMSTIDSPSAMMTNSWKRSAKCAVSTSHVSGASCGPARDAVEERPARHSRLRARPARERRAPRPRRARPRSRTRRPRKTRRGLPARVPLDRPRPRRRESQEQRAYPPGWRRTSRRRGAPANRTRPGMATAITSVASMIPISSRRTTGESGLSSFVTHVV